MYASLTQWVPAPRPAPEGEALFAIGDVHGHADELEALQHLILERIRAGNRKHCTVVYLGDYIDRGPSISRTLDLLAANPTDEPGLSRIYLLGNHEQFLLELVSPDASLDFGFLTTWFDNGGERTLQSLGVQAYGRLSMAGKFAELGARTRAALGSRRVEFLESLVLSHRADGYLFAHAGIDPALDLDAQDPADLLMIREPFLSAGQKWRHPFCVVHGHSISRPTVLSHRIGVDAGCYRYGGLCAAEIVEDQVRFLAVSKNRNHSWARLPGGEGPWRWSRQVSGDQGARTSSVNS